ncbi:hypothetical protein ACMGT0_17005 [Pseudomonas sp. RHF3.3-3]
MMQILVDEVETLPAVGLWLGLVPVGAGLAREQAQPLSPHAA